VTVKLDLKSMKFEWEFMTPEKFHKYSDDLLLKIQENIDLPDNYVRSFPRYDACGRLMSYKIIACPTIENYNRGQDALSITLLCFENRSTETLANEFIATFNENIGKLDG
jgi:hypothetical protein